MTMIMSTATQLTGMRTVMRQITVTNTAHDHDQRTIMTTGSPRSRARPITITNTITDTVIQPRSQDPISTIRRMPPISIGALVGHPQLR